MHFSKVSRIPEKIRQSTFLTQNFDLDMSAFLLSFSLAGR